MKRLSFDEFKNRSIEVHGFKYDYSKVDYINSQTKVEIVCPLHGSFFQKPNNHFSKGCCKCKGDKIKNTKLKKYGAENYNNFEKIKKTNLEKYGFETPLKNKDVQLKSKATLIERYGVNNIFKNEYIKSKVKNTNIERYGVDNVSKSDKIKFILSEKAKARDKNVYMKFNDSRKKKTVDDLKLKIGKNYEILLYNNYYDVKIRNTITNEISSESVYTILRRLKFSLSLTATSNSNLQIELSNFLKSFNVDFESNDRKIIQPLELDIYVPSKKLAIEFNGLYWHSEQHKKCDYHLKKTEECESKGIHLLHIYEDDWLYKQDIVKSRLKSILGLNEQRIFARKCIIKELDNKTSSEFLNQNHLQGGGPNSKYRYGLFFENELVAVMTFGYNRFEKNKMELHRFANKLDSNVIGGASKLFKHFLRQNICTEIISYADRSWTMNNNKSVYEQLGFKLINKTVSGYSYIINNKRFDRFKFRKSELIKDGFDSNKSEVEIMNERGYYRIFNSGNLKFLYKSI
jgi:hypothetical protein